MILLFIKVFITFSITIAMSFNVEKFASIMDSIVSLVTLYYTIKQGKRVKYDKQKQTVQK